MEEKIIQITNNHLNSYDEYDMGSAAKEIADHFREFIRWCITYVTDNSKDESYEYVWGADYYTFYGINELFEFWLTNIKEK